MRDDKEMIELISTELKTVIHSAFLKEFRFDIVLSNGVSFTNQDYFSKFPKYRDLLLEQNVYVSEINLVMTKEMLSDYLVDCMTFAKDCLGMERSGGGSIDKYQSNLISQITHIEERVKGIQITLKAVNTLDLESRHIVICNQILSIPLRLLAEQMERQEETQEELEEFAEVIYEDGQIRSPLNVYKKIQGDKKYMLLGGDRHILR